MGGIVKDVIAWEQNGGFHKLKCIPDVTLGITQEKQKWVSTKHLLNNVHSDVHSDLTDMIK